MVFSGYGISVDQRHLSLLSDYMTFSGSYRPFNRLAMASCSSPLQKMSFEACTKAMKDSMILGQADDLESPSARLVVGKLSAGGTGSFQLRTNFTSFFKNSQFR